ncbi:protein kinase family protein, partial [uncultured Kiloniella sp.]|uniref:protein kinase domain-containing protein n=1 Tax=uncultured Kiloniella sp. TaxID=1133091 RepID=UPI002627D5EB
TLLGYQDIEMIGKGAFGFAFSGTIANQNSELPATQLTQQVFKFSRINLPQHVQDRLEEEAFMLSLVKHPQVPQLIQYQRINKQSILVMERAIGEDLEKISLKYGPMPVHLIIKIAVQLADILLYLRNHQQNNQARPIVHGDIKPSNIVFDEATGNVGLIDWGSSVFAQIDHQGQVVSSNVMDLMSSDMQQTNARLGDVYFIGEDQLNGGLSSVWVSINISPP